LLRIFLIFFIIIIVFTTATVYSVLPVRRDITYCTASVSLYVHLLWSLASACLMLLMLMLLTLIALDKLVGKWPILIRITAYLRSKGQMSS